MIPPFIILLVIGLVILVKGSHYFVEGAIYLARRFGVTELVIGLTIVAMGTSRPELGVSTYAAYSGNSPVGVGDVVGSNVVNIALILGVTMLFRRVEIDEMMYRRDGFFMLGVSFLFAAMARLDGVITRLEGSFLLLLFISYLRRLYKQRSIGKVFGHPIEKRDALAAESFKLIGGLLGVLIGARLLVNSAVEIASILDVSKGAIGSTLVAFSTSLPELAVSLTALKKGHMEISVGNVLGSNIFNILWVIGFASLISPLDASDAAMRFNIPVMLLVAILLLLFMYLNRALGRREGYIFTGVYLVFLAANF